MPFYIEIIFFFISCKISSSLLITDNAPPCHPHSYVSSLPLINYLSSYLFISVQLDCANVENGKLEVTVKTYNYVNGDTFKGIKYIHNDFDATDAFNDACQVDSDTELISVTESTSAPEITCLGKAVSYQRKVTILKDNRRFIAPELF